MITNDDRKSKSKVYWKKRLILMFSLTIIIEAALFIIFPPVEPLTIKMIIMFLLVIFALVFVLVGLFESLNWQFLDFKNSSTKGKIGIAITFILAIIYLILKLKHIIEK